MPKLDVLMFTDLGYPAYVESAKAAEESGFDEFFLIDSTDAYSDYCAWDGLVAVNTSRIRIGPGVTNPLTRHPRVTANHMLTIHELSRGRAILGLGTGANAVGTLGWEPARHSVMREAIEIFRSKFRERKADIPIYIGTGGPLNTKMALQLADGIMVLGGGGVSSPPEGVVAEVDRLKAMAKEMGRDFSTLQVRMSVAFAISHNRKEAIEDIKGTLASSLRSIFVNQRSSWPRELERFREEAKKAGEAYDWFGHMRSHTPDGKPARHAQLISDDLAEALSPMAGTPQDLLPRFKALWQVVSHMPNVGFHLTVRGEKDQRKRSFDLLVKEVLPKLKGA